MLIIAVDLVYLRLRRQRSLVVETVENASGERAVPENLCVEYYKHTVVEDCDTGDPVGGLMGGSVTYIDARGHLAAAVSEDRGQSVGTGAPIDLFRGQ